MTTGTMQPSSTSSRRLWCALRSTPAKAMRSNTTCELTHPTVTMLPERDSIEEVSTTRTSRRSTLINGSSKAAHNTRSYCSAKMTLLKSSRRSDNNSQLHRVRYGGESTRKTRAKTATGPCEKNYASSKRRFKTSETILRGNRGPLQISSQPSTSSALNRATGKQRSRLTSRKHFRAMRSRCWLRSRARCKT